MARIRGGRWLDVSTASASGVVIHESACLQRLIEGMPNPACQHPQLWVFLGSTNKNQCLHTIFAQNASTRAPLGTIRLRADVGTIQNDTPVLFADGDPWRISTVPDASPARGGTRYRVDWDAVTPNEVIHRAYSEVLFPFADAVCLFADDVPVGADLAGLITQNGLIADIPHRAGPHLVIVMGRSEGAAAWSSVVGTNQISKVFSTVSILSSADADRGYDSLKGLLEARSQEVRSLRQAYTGQLSGIQLKTYLRSALAHLATTRNQPFDPIGSSRIPDDIPRDMGRNIHDFHQICTKEGLTDSDSARFVASALLMDHYRPETPLMDPTLVFQSLYRPRILDAGPPPTASLVDLIEAELMDEFIRLREQNITSLEHRKRSLVNGAYSVVKSNRVCLYCLVQAAQHFPSCDHPLCDLCAQRFGTPVVETEYCFSLDRCLLCGTAVAMVIETLPPTMDPSILAIDGGGVRGAIPLEFLILIEEYIRPCRVQDVFDLDISTSSGGLSDFGLRVLDLSVTACAELFDQLARLIFLSRRPAAFPWLPQCLLRRERQWLAWWKHDSCYDGTPFDTILRRLLGDQALLYSRNCGKCSKSGAKYGVVAASIGNKTETVILGNFNAAESTANDLGYRLIRPSNLKDEIETWRAARATAAPPFIFSPIDTSVGTLQDGGLTDNFAGGIARRVSRTIWPSRREPARLLSLGTGIPPQSSSESLPHFRHSLLDGFIRRAFSAWMSSLDAEAKWQEMKSQLDESIAGNFRRLNVPLEETSSALDDVTMIDQYRNLVLRHPASARMAKDASIELLTARFFFELDRVPVFGVRPFWCHGTIRCKGHSSSIVAALEQLVPGPLEFVTDLHRLGPILAGRDICPSCSRFCWPVSLLCHDTQHSLQVYIKAGRYGKWRINSFPSTPIQLVRRQQLDLPFGKADHGCPARKPCLACESGRTPFRGRRRRRHSISAAGERRKRVCLGLAPIDPNQLPYSLTNKKSTMPRKRDRPTFQGRVKTILKKLREVHTICGADFYLVVVRDGTATVVNSKGGSWPPGNLEQHYATRRFTLRSLGEFLGSTDSADSEPLDLNDLEVPRLRLSVD